MRSNGKSFGAESVKITARRNGRDGKPARHFANSDLALLLDKFEYLPPTLLS